MSEPIIYFGIGFLLALSLFFSARPLAHSRLGRFAMSRLESAAPTMMADIEADMGQLHSQIAVATRRLEMSVEQMKVKTTSQLSEISSTSAAIARLKAEHGEKAALFAHLQDKERALISQVRTTEAELATKTSTLAEVEQTLSDRKAEFSKLMEEFDVHPEVAKLESRHRAEIESVKAEKAMLEDQLRQSQEQCTRLQDEIDSWRKQVESTWASERMANAVLRERINDVATEVVRVAVALEGLSSPIDTLVAGKAASVQAEAGGDGDGASPEAGDNGDGSKTTLVHRIRALRKRNGQPHAAE